MYISVFLYVLGLVLEKTLIYNDIFIRQNLHMIKILQH